MNGHRSLLFSRDRLQRALVVFALFALAATVGAQPAREERSQSAALQSGPMVGYSDMREVMLWAQTTRSANVHFVYWDIGAPGLRHRTRGRMTRPEDGFTTHQIADQLEPGKRYAYEVWVNDRRVPRPYPLSFQTQHLWQWRTDPPPFRMAVGSCLYVVEPVYDRPGDQYGQHPEILTSVARTRPDVMLWLGDNVYLREVDWNSRGGMMKRYTHSRALPELQPLLGSVHHYAIWDDHDFGPNNSDRSWVLKDSALDVFKLFWANPSYGVNGRPGVTTMFQWADVDFFLVDDRYYRAPSYRRTGDRSHLGNEQVEWLIDALTTSRAPFKIVATGSQVLRADTTHESYGRSPAELQRLLDALVGERIPGVMFLSGDLHMSELIRVPRPGTYPLYELTVSPLTAGPYLQARPDPNAVPGTLVRQRNFALLDFSGPRRDRAMKITVFDTNGRELWTRTIRASELRGPQSAEPPT